MVVFSAGIRPRDELAKAAGLQMGERGGVVVDDGLPHVRPQDLRHRRVRPGPRRRPRPAPHLRPGGARLPHGPGGRRPHPGRRRRRSPGADMSTKLKLLGIDVASFGDAFGTSPGAESITYSDPVANVYKPLVVGPPDRKERRTVVGGILVGDAVALPDARADGAGRHAHARPPGGAHLPGPHRVGAAHHGRRRPVRRGRDLLLQQRRQGRHLRAPSPSGTQAWAASRSAPRPAPAAAAASPLVTELLRFELKRPAWRSTTTCASTSPTPARSCSTSCGSTGITSFSELLTSHGKGKGCEICKPAVASMLASLGSGYILDGEQATLQDTNDHFLANLQRDGTYSVVPRVPGGRDHPRPAHRHRRGGQGLRALHQDHRRPAHRPVRRPGRPAPRTSGAGWSTSGWSRATPTARRCAR